MSASALYDAAESLQSFTDKAKALAADIRELAISNEPNVIDLALIHKEAELKALIDHDFEGAMTSLMFLYQGAAR